MTQKRVSRETLDKLNVFQAMLVKWNRTINLVSPKTIPNLWERHIEDSLEIVFSIPNPKGLWVDLGSGGGFPGLIAAIASADLPDIESFALIESDQRKCAFLRAVIRELDLPANVISQRIDDAPPQNADIVSARALAPLIDLLGYALRHGRPSAQFLFPKGVTWNAEITDAQSAFEFDLEVVPSVTQEGSVILVIQGATRVKDRL